MGKSLRYRDSMGRPQCRACYRKDESRWEPCAECGRHRPINARTDDAKALCGTCYRDRAQPTATCDDCGMLGRVAVRTGRRGADRTLCARCYEQPARRCGGCGRVRRVALRATGEHPDLCPTCYQAPIEQCGHCGAEDLCRRTTNDGAPICFRCQLSERLDELLAGPDPAITDLLMPVRDAVLAVDNPRTGLGWLARSRGADLLDQIARGERQLSHDTLDAEKPGMSIEHLRRMLVAAGALPERNEHLARLERFAETLEASAAAADGRVLRSFATWHVLYHLRANETRRPITANACYRCRTELAATARFLAKLRDRGRDLATCQQPDIDQATPSPAAANALLPFLRWAIKQRLLPTLQLPKSPPHQPRVFVDNEDRWALARLLLQDETITASDRVAGLLVLLYGQTSARIARLTVTDITHRNDQPRLRLGRGTITLPEPLASLICRLPERAPTGIAAALATTSPWLFPGRQPDRPIHPASLNRRLTRLDIDPRADRNTALLQLAGELPVPVVADLLGLHLVTAERWAQAAAAGWAAYAASR
ncbi:hypothetical protein [Amycolatopsis sp. NPDC049868]|uniref:hypothetical protein n=1 Tax=Amycolatopsis sp. NPDC049868 TaxID=3363934 RepID=UPI00379237B3